MRICSYIYKYIFLIYAANIKTINNNKINWVNTYIERCVTRFYHLIIKKQSFLSFQIEENNKKRDLDKLFFSNIQNSLKTKLYLKKRKNLSSRQNLFLNRMDAALKKAKDSIGQLFDKNMQDLVRGIRNHKENEVNK